MGEATGLVNSEALLDPNEKPAIALANFALAGDTLVILASNRLYTVKLAVNVTTGGAFAGGAS